MGLIGLSLADVLAAESRAGPARQRAPAKACILFFMEGGPAHQDLFDLKPLAPREIRGEFEPIATSVPGIPVCEHLPLLARQMHHVAQVRSVHHKIVDHNAGAYYCLSGRSPVEGGRLIVGDEPTNFPPYGSVVAQRHPVAGLPAFVHLPDIMSNNNHDLPGQRGGFLSRTSCAAAAIGAASNRTMRRPTICLPGPRSARPSTSGKKRPPFASGMGCPIAKTVRSKPANLAACRTWGSACSWRGD